MTSRIRAASCLAAVLVLALGMPAGATDTGATEALPTQTHEVVATGLNNPRGLHADGNVVYVAESGRGGPQLLNIATPGGGSFNMCLGDTGSISRIDENGQTRLPKTYPSMSAPLNTPDGPVCPGTGSSATGPADLTKIGANLVVAMSSVGAETVRSQTHPLFGHVLQVLPNGKHISRGDLVAHEEEFNPDGRFIDSNPYGIISDGGRLWVADAAANTIVQIKGTNVSTTVVIEQFDPVPFELPSCLSEPLPGMPPAGTPIAPESVPTKVAYGADGYLYVSTLPGFPFSKGSAKLFRVHPDTGETTVVAEGLSTLTGLAIGPDGAVYVAEMLDAGLMEGTACGNFVPGRILKLTGDGMELVGSAPLIGGLAVTDDGSVYASVLSPFAGAGQVWKFSPN